MATNESNGGLLQAVQRRAGGDFCGVPIPILFCVLLAAVSGTFVSILLPANQQSELIERGIAAQSGTRPLLPAARTSSGTQGAAPTQRVPG